MCLKHQVTQLICFHLVLSRNRFDSGVNWSSIYGFASHWFKKSPECFKPITNHSKRPNHVQCFRLSDLAKEASLFTVADTPIENVRAFTYPCHVITNIDEKCFTDFRVSHATTKFLELYRVLTDKSVKIKTRLKLLELCIRSGLIYATQAMLSKSPEMAKLESCRYNFLRRMMRGGFSKKSQNQNDFTFKTVRG